MGTTKIISAGIILTLNLIITFPLLFFAQDNTIHKIFITSSTVDEIYKAGSSLVVSWGEYPTSGTITAINLYRGSPQNPQLITTIATNLDASKGDGLFQMIYPRPQTVS